MTVVQRLLDVAYTNMGAFRKIEQVVDTQSRKVTDKIVASVFTVSIFSVVLFYIRVCWTVWLIS